MYNAEDIIELEEKYSKYIKKKWIKIVPIIILLLLIPFYIILQKSNILNEAKESINKSPRNIEMLDKQAVELKKNNFKSTKHLVKTAILKNQENGKIKKENLISKNSSVSSNNEITSKMDKNNTNYATTKNRLNINAVVLKLTKIKKEKRKEEILTVKKDIKIPKVIQKKEPPKKIDNAKIDNAKIDNDNNHLNDIKIESKSIDAITYLKDKFYDTRDIKTALLLCEKYYQKKDFKNSLKWSMVANGIDNTNEKSWIWFARSKYKLNQKKDAIKALKAYLSTNNSKSIRSLLEEISNRKIDDK